MIGKTGVWSTGDRASGVALGMPTFTGPANCVAVPTLDSASLPVEPAQVALTLQRHLCALIQQGYEVLSVTPIPGAVLCVAVSRVPLTYPYDE